MADASDLETGLLGAVLPDRTCGGCTACCTTLKVDTPEFRKPAGKPCPHLGDGGCSIHAVRPTICRSWFCGWRRLAALPDAARPDRSGLLVSLSFERHPRNCFEGVAITVRALPGRAIDREMARVVLDAVCDRLVPVWFSDGTHKMLMHPEQAVADLVLSGAPAPAPLAEEVAAWRARYAMFAPADAGP